MAFWLLKSEPATWSWAQQKHAVTTVWDGVRNYQANNYMKQMQLGDQALFYHSGHKPHIIGIVTVSRPFYPDAKCPPFGFVDIRYHSDLNQPVYLDEIKADAQLMALALIKQPRLSVMPIDNSAWDHIINRAQSKP